MHSLSISSIPLSSILLSVCRFRSVCVYVCCSLSLSLSLSLYPPLPLPPLSLSFSLSLFLSLPLPLSQLIFPDLVEGLVLLNIDPNGKGWIDWAAGKVLTDCIY